MIGSLFSAALNDYTAIFYCRKSPVYLNHDEYIT